RVQEAGNHSELGRTAYNSTHADNRGIWQITRQPNCESNRLETTVLLAGPAGNTCRVSPTEFHPDLRSVARYMPKQIVTPVTVPFIRAAERLLWRRTPDDIEVLTLPSGAGVRLFRPARVTGHAPALLWIHGGGYVIGMAAQDDALCGRFARELGATVAS